MRIKVSYVMQAATFTTAVFRPLYTHHRERKAFWLKPAAVSQKSLHRLGGSGQDKTLPFTAAWAVAGYSVKYRR